MATIFITGVSRGIGLELTRQALARGETVYGTARHPSDSEALSKLQAKNEKSLHVLPLDVTDHQLPTQLEKLIAKLPTIDILINNAGVFKDGTTAEDFLASFRTNSIAPFLLTQAFLPLLKKSKNPRAVHITSLMGSIAENSSGGSYAYRASKAALNMISKSLTVDQPWLTTAVLHPGWVKTDMGGENAPTDVTASAEGLWKVINSLATPMSGHYFDFKGREIPW